MKVLDFALKTSVEAQESGDQLVVLAIIRHETIGSPLRMANAVVDITSQGDVFTAFPFSIDFPQVSETNSRGRIQIPNVDTRIGQFLLTLNTPPQIELVLVSSQDWDVWIIHLRRLFLRSFRGDTTRISADITTWDLATEPWPARRMVQANYPAVFWP